MTPKRDLVAFLSAAVGVPYLQASAWPATCVGAFLLAFGVFAGVDSAFRTVRRFGT